MPSYVVTGASRGIGREFVQQLSMIETNTVFALVRNKETSPKLVQLVGERLNVHILEADITDHKTLKAAASSVSDVTGGKLDILINNAAFIDKSLRMGYTLDQYPDGQENLLETDLRKAFDVNVIGVIHTINAFLPLLREGTTKKVITLSSGVADYDFTMRSGFSTNAPYSISKAALNMVNVKYATQYATEGFIFLALSPGLVSTAETMPSKEQIEVYVKMMAKFRNVKPDLKGAMTPGESVKMQLDVIHNLRAEHNGEFLSHLGNKEFL